MGQWSGGLRHPEGSRPLLNQAGKRLPPSGIQNTLMTQPEQQGWQPDNTCKEKRGSKRLYIGCDNFNYQYFDIGAKGELSVVCLCPVLLYIQGFSWVFPRVSVSALPVSYCRSRLTEQRAPPNILFFPRSLNILDFPDLFTIY